MGRNWRREVARLCVGLLRSANYGRLPGVCVADWREIARRFGVALHVTTRPGPPGAVILDDVIVVRSRSTDRQTCAAIAHELTELLLTTEVEAPYCHPVSWCVSQSEERHLVAREVESQLGLRRGFAH